MFYIRVSFQSLLNAMMILGRIPPSSIHFSSKGKRLPYVRKYFCRVAPLLIGIITHQSYAQCQPIVTYCRWETNCESGGGPQSCNSTIQIGENTSESEYLNLILQTERACREGLQGPCIVEYNGITNVISDYVPWFTYEDSAPKPWWNGSEWIDYSRVDIELKNIETQFRLVCPPSYPYSADPWISPGGRIWRKTKYFKECQEEAYTIKLSNDAGTPSLNQLAELQPGQVSEGFRATVYDQNDQVVPNASIELMLDVLAGSGGHLHDNNRNSTQMGRLESPQGVTTQNGKVLTGTTDANGLAFTFTAPPASGDHTIKAKCTDRNCNQEGPNQLWVGIKNLYPLDSNGPAYTLIEPNADTFHPDNHYLTVNAYLALVDIASQWHTLYRPFGPLLHLNDASLERGGAFDIDRRWGGGTRPRHAEHRRGTVIDIRANITPGAIPESDFLDFTDLVSRNRPAIAEIHCEKNSRGQCNVSTRHFHVRLFGRKE